MYKYEILRKKSGDKNLRHQDIYMQGEKKRHKMNHQGMNTHGEETHPRTGSGTNTSLKEKGSTVLNVPLHKSIFFGSTSIH